MCRFIQQLGFYNWSCLTSLQSKIFQLLLTNITNIQSVIKKHFEVTTGTDKKCDRISVFTKEPTHILRARGQNKESVYIRMDFCVNILPIREGADKSLARPGRKQATATKLGIYSTYSPRSSIHFLARCSNFCKLLKKTQKDVHPTGSLRQQWPPRWTKMATFQLFFQSREQVAVRRGQIQRIGWVIKTLEPQVSQFLLGCKCLVSWGIVMQEQDPLVTFPQRFFFKMSLNCTSRDE